MSKLTGPLLSLGARGQIGKSLVYSKWRGKPYVRQLVVPTNPNTLPQQFNRNAFATLREMWKLAPAGLRAPWDLFATGRPFLGMNKFIGENRLAMTTDADMSAFLASPGAKGGLPPVSVTAAAGANAGDLLVTIVAPDEIPIGWTLVKAWAVAFPQQAPDARFAGPFVILSDAAAPYAITLEGFAAGAACVAAGWLEWTKADGSTAYSPSLVDTAAAHA